MPPAARKGDKVIQDVLTHCHMPHPKGPVATPHPHPATPLAITGPCSLTVKIQGVSAARVTDITEICSLKGCIPAGPGIITKGSTSVRINGMPAARLGDITTHATCVAAPIPSPTGKILPPCSTTVRIGG